VSRGRIIVVDDDRDHLRAVSDWLAVSGFDVGSFERAEEAYKAALEDGVDIVLTDVRMPNIDGMTLLNSLQRQKPELPVVLLTAHGDVSLAVAAMKRGAEDFIEKPYDAERLISVLNKALEKKRMKEEIVRLQGLVGDVKPSETLIGDSASMQALRQRVAALAAVDIDVLIIGETGTGKELVAQALHRQSSRASAPFVAINCGALPETLFESEVFGHVKGAFTGALTERVGKFEFAEGGTIFLDEIEAMPLSLQAKILRVLQERVIERLGENRLRPVNVRILAAAKSDLSAEMSASRFREDLFFRLATVDVRIPTLRERREDIEALFVHFASLAARRYGRSERDLSPELLADLKSQDWKGNVRALKARAERFALGLDELPTSSGTGGDARATSLPDQLAAYEGSVIAQALQNHQGSTARAAADLQIPLRTLNEKIAKYSIKRTKSPSVKKERDPF
jgi:two-component system, NtrC family, C4-dicarboxylate transport response regulator DctD